MVVDVEFRIFLRGCYIYVFNQLAAHVDNQPNRLSTWLSTRCLTSTTKNRLLAGA